MATNPVGPQPAIQFIAIGDGTIQTISKTSALIGYKDGNNQQVSLLSRYCAAPVAVAQAILQQINYVTDGSVRALLAATYSTDQVLEDSPESLPPGRVLKFRSWKAGEDPTSDIPVTLSQYVPYAVFESAEEWTTVGEGIAAALTGDANFELVEFIKPRRR